MREGFSYQSAEAFTFHQKPDDRSGGSAETPPTVLRHMTNRGELSLDTRTGLVRSPLLPNDIYLSEPHESWGRKYISNGERALEALLRNPTRVLDDRTILEAMWGKLSYDPDDLVTRNNAKHCISILRKKLGEERIQRGTKHGENSLIYAVQSRGHTFLSPESALEVDHELVLRFTTPLGEIVFNYESLVTSSPLVANGKTPISITPQEGELLRIFTTSGGKIIESPKIPSEYHSQEQTKKLVQRLRRKLGDTDARLIRTARDVGYQLPIAD